MPKVTVIFHTFSGIRFCVNCVLCIGVTQPSKFTINMWNEVCLTIEIGVYISSHERIVLSLNCQCLRDLGSYRFPKYTNACMIYFEEVGIFSILTIFEPSIFDQLHFEFKWGCELVRWFRKFEVMFPYIFLLKTPILLAKGVKGFFNSIHCKIIIHPMIFCTFKIHTMPNSWFSYFSREFPWIDCIKL